MGVIASPSPAAASRAAPEQEIGFEANADLERNERMAWGSPEQVCDTFIELAESLGSATVILTFNQGAMPHAMCVRNLQRFGKEVLPALQAHAVTAVPLA
ncbi:MAG TPA: hypothetical protein VNP04_12945 [Alphaproteobacteria bacterium]|nr:hypothetical protein [Alphaproteobacteria bacterium]